MRKKAAKKLAAALDRNFTNESGINLADVLNHIATSLAVIAHVYEFEVRQKYQIPEDARIRPHGKLEKKT